MEILNPIMLSFLGLIPVVVVIHMIRQKQRKVLVTTYFLWEDNITQTRWGIILHHLKANSSLLMQILIIILIALALAQPAWHLAHGTAERIIVIIDISASMKTQDPLSHNQTRIEKGKDKAREIIRKKASSCKAMLIESGVKPKILVPFTEDKKHLYSSIKGITASEAPTDLIQALYLALSFIQSEKEEVIYCLTDKIDSLSARFIKLHPTVKPILISGGTQNTGITRFAFRQKSNYSDNYELFVEIKNYNDIDKICPWQLKIDTTIIVNDSIFLKPGEKRQLFLPYKGILRGNASAVLLQKDDFSVDNTAYSVLSSVKTMKVLLVSPGNIFLENLFRAYPHCLLDTLKEIDTSQWEHNLSQYNIIIIDRMSFPYTDRGNLLLIDAYSPSIPFFKLGPVASPRNLDWDRKHPLTTNVNLDGLFIGTATKIKAAPETKAIITSTETDLLYYYSNEKLSIVFMGFDILQSDLPVRVAFPVLMSNIINYLNPHILEFSVLQTKTGTPFHGNCTPSATQLRIQKPGKAGWYSFPELTRSFVFHQTLHTGVYTVDEGNRRWQFAVNLTDDNESDIANPGTYKVEESIKSSETKTLASYRHLWPVFLYLIILALVGELFLWLKGEKVIN